MKLLLVSWHFPPHNTIAAIRLGKLSAFLQALGHDVRVITSVKPNADCSLPLELGHDRVTRTPFLDVDAVVNPLAWRDRLRARLVERRGSPLVAPRTTRSGGQSWLSKLYLELVFVPDRYNGWILPLFLSLRRLLAGWTPDLVMVSGPPFSAFVAVAVFGSWAKVPWIAEFRDRWADDPYALIPDWRRVIDRRLEAWSVSRAAGLITVSEPEALRRQAQADILLLLQWDDPADESNVPGKVFEYLAARRPILGLGPLQGIPARLIRERRAGFFSNDTRAITTQLQLWANEKRRNGAVAPLPPEVSAGLERDQQYALIERFLGQIHAERTAGTRRGEIGRTASLAATLRSPCFASADSSRLERPALCVIVDTEADFDWTGPFSRDEHSLRSIAGIGRVQELFDRFGVRPTYLVDYPVATDPAAIRTLGALLDQGRCDIGVQLHAWTTPPFDELLCERNSYGCNLPRHLQEAKLATLMAAVARAFTIKPRVFKAGRYGFADASAELLEEADFLVDTSVLPFTALTQQGGPTFHGVPDGPYWFGQRRPMLELPVTRHFAGLLRRCAPGRVHRLVDNRLGRGIRLPGIFARLGLLDRLTLTPEGMTYENMRDLAAGLVADGRRVLTLSFHSPSLAPGNTPYVRSEAELQSFLERLGRFVTYFLEDLGGKPRTALQLHQELLPGGHPFAEKGRRSGQVSTASPGA